ncbi:hypothetical protein [Companilactobacillus halodurans]|uniref:Uncharacterized protein n=1 Tax=Companilactobacillus halodurans TaxID=2584183 RepID=A0A5P0ZV83_9LACO|nr:hypothetical protein [Companilactobacillus halodurans]MQS76539.1 hypothetical protein [Companilactobacillus halodurans]MQS96921.1 hypothetical protein [Companilactobacillus halodurans]
MFQYSLRYSIDYRTNTKAKDDKLLDFCQNALIDNVTFFMNSEEINAGHLDAEQTQTWLDAIEKIAKKLKKSEITFSLNPFSTLMHSDRGQKIAAGFEPMVDQNGRVAQSIGCPADEKWRDYLTDRYAQYASIHPKELWLEDDFRHFNHSPLELGCFCDHHMKIYQDKLDEKISRAQFVKKILQTGEPTKERRVYLDVARQEMIETVHQIEGRVHVISPQTNLALMTSLPDWHALEARDWNKLFDNLSGAGHPRIARPHLPAYNEIAPLKYSRTFEKYTRTTAAYLGDEAQLFPELENYMYSPFVKSLKFTQFQIETSALVGAKGILMNLFDMSGNGINDEYHYAEMLAESKPFLNEITSRTLKMGQSQGIKILVDQDSSYTLHTKIGKDIKELLPHETNWAALLSTFGFATSIVPYQSGLRLEDEIIAISGQLFRNMKTEQVTDLIENNIVLLDGKAVQVLLDRDLGKLLHIKSAKWHQVRSGYQTFESADNQTIEGIKNPRISMLQHTGDYLQLDYDNEAQVDVWTYAYNQEDKKLGKVMTMIDDHIIVMPMNEDEKYGWESQYIGFKQVLYQKMLDSIVSVDYLSKMPNTKLAIGGEDSQTLWIANFTLDDYNQITWHAASEVAGKKAVVILRHDNQSVKKEVVLRQKDDNVIIPIALPHLTLVQVRIEEDSEE